MTGDGSDELFAGYNYLSRYYSDMQRFDRASTVVGDYAFFFKKTRRTYGHRCQNTFP